MNEANGKSVDRPCGRIKMVPIYASDDVIDEVKIVAFDSEKKKFVLRVNIKQFTKRGCRRLVDELSDHGLEVFDEAATARRLLRMARKIQRPDPLGDETALSDSKRKLCSDPDGSYERQRSKNDALFATAVGDLAGKKRKKHVKNSDISTKDGSESLSSNKHVDNINIHSNKTNPPDVNSDNANLYSVISNPPFSYKHGQVGLHIKDPICDKLSLTFKAPGGDPTDVDSVIRYLSIPSDDRCFLKEIKLPQQQLYKNSYLLLEPDGMHVAVIQCNPVKPKANFGRIEFNPSVISSKGMEGIVQFMKGLFGSDYREVLADSNISRLDVACDIIRSRPSDIIVFSNRSRASSLWRRSFSHDGIETWETETSCIGSQLSDYFVRVYDKSAQLWKVKGIVSEDPVVRIEASVSPRLDGKVLTARDISKMNNPFAPIHVAHYPAPADDKPWFNFFVCAVREYGSEQALKMIQDRSKRVEYRQYLLNHEVQWWNPEALWDVFLKYLNGLDLFPDSAS